MASGSDCNEEQPRYYNHHRCSLTSQSMLDNLMALIYFGTVSLLSSFSFLLLQNRRVPTTTKVMMMPTTSATDDGPNVAGGVSEWLFCAAGLIS